MATGAIIDDTCEKDTQKAQQYRQNAKEYLDGREERIDHLKYLNQLKNEGKIEIGLTESDVLYILGEPPRKTKTIATTTFKYDYNF